MPRYYKKTYKNNKNNDDDEGTRIIAGFIVLYVVCLVFNYKANPTAFWELLVGGIALIIVLIFCLKAYKKYKEESERQKVTKILNKVKQIRAENYIDEFITKFGLGQEKDKNSFVRGRYKISRYRIDSLRNILNQKGCDFSNDEMDIILSNYIDKKELDWTRDSITNSNNKKFSELNKNGIDFEQLVRRLYQSMGYSVEPTKKQGITEEIL